jgi:hypothetical protein
MLPIIILFAYASTIAAIALTGGIDSTTLSRVHNNILEKVQADLEQIATHSWELGTETETLIEFNMPGLSVYETGYPPPQHLRDDFLNSYVFKIAQTCVTSPPSGLLTCSINILIQRRQCQTAWRETTH